MIFFLFTHCLGAAPVLPKPPYAEICKDESRSIHALNQFLEENNIQGFYEMADVVLKRLTQEARKEKSGSDVKEILWLRYLIAKAPLVNLDDKKNLDWFIHKGDLDYEVKAGVLRRLSFQVFRDPDADEKLQLNSKDALEIFIACNAVILAQFRREVIPDWELAMERLEQKFLEKQKKERDSSEDTRAFFNQLNIRGGRAAQVESIVPDLEKNFMNLLVRSYPTKAVEVKKYLRMAGYTDQEMPDLLDRTIGRVPEAAYLYKGFPKRRNERDI